MQDLITKNDKSNYLTFLTNFSQQIKDANQIEIPKFKEEFKSNINNVVIAGMGGSAIAGDFARSMYSNEFKVPVIVSRDYSLPKFANENTLLLACSYSGNTEETLSTFDDGLKKGVKILSITTGGILEEKSKANNIDVIYLPKNYQPRAALGFGLIPILNSLSGLGLLTSKENDIVESINLIDDLQKKFTFDNLNNSEPYQMAKNIVGKIPLMYTGPAPFDVMGTRWKGQLNENSKVLAYNSIIPELNHNEIMGWAETTPNLKDYFVFIVRDDLDNERVKLRMNITKEILEKYGVPVQEVSATGNSILTKIFSLVYLGDWLSFYLAMLTNTDPTPIGNINHLKENLSNN